MSTRWRLVTVATLIVSLPSIVAAQQRRQQRDAVTAAATQLDRVGRSIFRLEQRAYEISAGALYSDAEDAQGDRHELFRSSVTVLRLAVAADSSNAAALFHLGQALAQASYTGWGEWDTTMLREAVGKLESAERRAVGRFAPLRPSIRADLAREHASLATLRRRS